MLFKQTVSAIMTNICQTKCRYSLGEIHFELIGALGPLQIYKTFSDYQMKKENILCA